MLVGEGRAKEWLNKIDWKKPIEDFQKKTTEDQDRAKGLAKTLYWLFQKFPQILLIETYPTVYSKPKEPVLEFFERFQKTFKQYSGMENVNTNS